jgi:hypothetical protein
MRLPRVVAVLAATACVAIASMAIVSTASARTLAQARAVCPDGSICLFEAADWNGKWVSSRYAINRLTQFGFNDVTSSFVNDSPEAFCMLEAEINLPWSNGGAWIWSSGWGSTNFVGWDWNDRISAVKKMVSAGRIC